MGYFSLRMCVFLVGTIGLFSSCAKSRPGISTASISSTDSEKAPVFELSTSQLDGVWENSCFSLGAGIQGRNKDSYQGDEFTWEIDLYTVLVDPDACRNQNLKYRMQSYKASGFIFWGEEVGDKLYQIDFVIEKLTNTPWQKTAAKGFNAEKLCGETGWVKGLEKEVSGGENCSFYFKGKLFDTIEIDEGQLKYAVGVEPNSPETRYRDILETDLFVRR